MPCEATPQSLDESNPPRLSGKKNFRLTIEYDGGNYHGWQRQDGCITLQETIENRISMMVGTKTRLIGSGRTDAGVHALGQVANFVSGTRIPPEKLQMGLNSLLPGDIVIRRLEEVSLEFHSRYDVKRKTYRYHILNQRIPTAIGRNYSWHIRTTLDFQAMSEAAAHLAGTHDFKSFEGSGSPRPHTVREVYAALWESPDSGRLTFTISANGFLRFMVRTIVGTLVDVGLGRISPAEFREILLARDRRRAGATAPAHGLFLVEVEY